MGQKTAILAVGIIIFTVILTFILILSRIHGGSKNSDINTTVTEVATRNVVSVNDVVNNPMVYNGYNLEVDSQISGWATNRSFYFNGGAGATFGGGPRRKLLVIAKEPFQLPQNPTDEVLGLGEIAKVTTKGTIQVLNQQQLQDILGVNLSTSNQSTSSASLYDPSLKNWTVGPVLILDTLIVEPKKK